MTVTGSDELLAAETSAAVAGTGDGVPGGGKRILGFCHGGKFRDIGVGEPAGEHAAEGVALPREAIL